MRGPTVVAVLSASLCLLPAAARGQHLGPFAPAAGWWIGPNLTSGVSRDGPGTTLTIDTNGNGIIDGGDHTHAQPAEIASWTLRLSPSRGFLYAFAGGGACGGSRVRFYRIPAASGAPLVPVGAETCIPVGIATVRFFDQPSVTDERRVAILVALPAGASSTQDVWWFDLVGGGVATTAPSFDRDIGEITVSPSGLAAYVESDHDGDALLDYDVVSLCPGSLGALVTPSPGNALTQVGASTAAMVDAGGVLSVSVTFTAGGAPPAPIPVPACTGSGGTALGAACLPGGGCLDGLSAADAAAIGATWAGAGTACTSAGCAPPPPAPALTFTILPPATAKAGLPASYTLQWANTGTASATGAVLRDRVPAGSTFLAASGGGTYASGTGDVTWSLGTLAPGASGSVTLEVAVGCATITLVNSVSSLGTSSPALNLPGPVLTSPVTAAPTSAVQATIGSVALAPQPLHAGDAMRHTLHLVNSGGGAHDSLTVTIAPGTGAAIAGVISVPPGRIASGPSSLTWVGPLAAGAAVDLVFDTAVSTCLSPFTTQVRLHNGSPVPVRNPCGVTVGSATPSPVFALAPPPVGCELVATSTPSPTLGPGTATIALARRGSPVDFELRVFERDGAAVTAFAAGVTLPASLSPAGNPPWIGTPPAGAAFDAATRRISWSGPLAALDTVRVAFRADLAADACSPRLDVTGGGAGCAIATQSSLTLFAASVPPAVGHLVGGNPTLGLATLRPGADTQLQSLVCFGPEAVAGFARTPDGGFWLAGRTTMLLNPRTLELRRVPVDLAAALGRANLQDIALDPFDGTLLVLADGPVAGQWRVGRYDPVAGTLADLFGHAEVPGVSTTSRFWVDRDGRVLLMRANGFVRVPPADPAAAVAVTAPGGASLTALAVDVDGDVLGVLGTLFDRPLVQWHPATAVFDTVVASMTSLLPLPSFANDMAVAGNGDVYLTAGFGPLGRVHRTVPADADTVAASAFVGGLLWAPGDGALGAPEPTATAPGRLELGPVGPSPFASRATVRFALPRAGEADLRVFDLAGREVARLASGPLPAGAHARAWDGRDGEGRPVGAGVYFVRLRAAGLELRTRLVRLR